MGSYLVSAFLLSSGAGAQALDPSEELVVANTAVIPEEEWGMKKHFL